MNINKSIIIKKKAQDVVPIKSMEELVERVERLEQKRKRSSEYFRDFGRELNVLEAKVNAMQEYIEKTTGKTLKELYFEDF